MKSSTLRRKDEEQSAHPPKSKSQSPLTEAGNANKIAWENFASWVQNQDSKSLGDDLKEFIKDEHWRGDLGSRDISGAKRMLINFKLWITGETISA